MFQLHKTRDLFPSIDGLFFDSESDSSQSTQTSANTSNYDRRIGIEGAGSVVATEGSNITLNTQNLDPAVVRAALESGAQAVDITTRSNATVSQAAIDAAQESARVSASVATNAIDANSSVADTSIRASVQTSETAIGAVQESARINASVAANAIDANTSLVDTSLRAGTANAQAAISSAQEAARVATAAMLQSQQNAVAAAQESARVATAAVNQSAANALASNTEVTRLGYSGILQGQDRALDTADRSVALSAGIAELATDNARTLVLANNDLTETTRRGNQELVKLVADKLSTSVQDERRDINATLIENVTKYGALALGAAAVAAGLAFAIRKTSKA